MSRVSRSPFAAVALAVPALATPALATLSLAALALAAPLAVGASGALAQSPPTLEQYPLRDRIFGPGGAVFPDYVTPSEFGITYYTGAGSTAGKGGGKGGGESGNKSGSNAIFGAATADFNCQQSQVPTIQVLSAPRGAKVSTGFGSFIATGRDGGAITPCMGRPMKGTVVRYKGRAAPGESVRLRVTYPTLGAWYDHVVPVPAR